jgi:chemotaxis protein MotB
LSSLSAQRKSIHSGRFARWHLESNPPAEEEAWLLTYLDVMTLLLVMMVVILAFSKPAGKSPGEGEGVAPSPTGSVLTAAAPASASAPSAAVSNPSPRVPPAPQPGPLDRLPLDALGDNVEVIKVGNTVRFRIKSELLFSSGDSGLTPEGRELVDSLLPIFNLAIDHNIVVEGHTDNLPISTERFPSNWELAAGRAGSVVRHLENRGLNPTRLRATGFGETRPIAPNTTAQGQSTNRRVELILALPPEYE